MYVITKCTLGFITIWSLLSLAIKQNTAQNCTTVRNVLHNRVYWKPEFSVCFGFVKHANTKSLHLQLSIQAISRDILLTW